MSTTSASPARVDLRAHFGLHAAPLTREFPIDRRMPLMPAEQAIDALRTVVEDRMSAALIAPAGTGKSVVLRALIDSLPEARYRGYGTLKLDRPEG